MDALYAQLAEAIEKSNKSYDLPRIEAAYELAKKAHEGQVRSSGDPYISHPIAVAVILVGLGMDSDTIIGGLLHDVVEDTSVTLEDIEKQFGADVAELVDGVTKLANIPYSSRAEQQAENVRKMLLAMAKDVRVVIIKLADRLHNMRTLDFRIPEKQRVKSLETMEIYAPLAHRLGIRSVKEELEDLSLKHLDPVAYHEIEQQLALRKEDREAFLKNIIKRIQARLESEHVTAQIDGRVKSIYGIYRKMYIQGRSFDEIYDIYAVRIIVDTVLECYNILGIIHDMLRPIPNRFKDYISTPKQNMYQSLHTTVLDKEGVPFEVQIRTWDMHYTAGKLALEKEMRRNLIAPPAEEREKFIADIAARQKYNTVDDFYASIGYGGVSLEKIMPRIKDDFIRLYRKTEQTLAPTVKKSSQKASNGVIVEGLEGCLIKFARCCNPLPGDEIVGFITRGFGVSIHKCDCANVVNARRRGEDPERWVKATWASKVKETFKSTLDILASDRIGILADVSVQLGNMRVPIHSVMAKELKTGQTSIQVSIGISDLNQLQTIINNLSRIPGVSSVKRAVLS